MIYTLTINPSVDYFLNMNNFTEGELNLSTASNTLIGGKGINVSLVLNNLQIKTTALGFVGGFTGNHIITILKDNKISNDFINIKENTRINIKLYNYTSNSETEISGVSPYISPNQENDLVNKILSILKDDDILVLSGSIPSSISKDIYKIISKSLSPTIKVVLDTRGSSLKDNLYNNFLIKPNINELREMFGRNLKTDTEIIDSCNYFFDLGVKNIIVSMGKEGSLFINKLNIYKANPITLDIKNSVGAGDSMVAGFVYGTILGKSIKDSYKLAIASSYATITSKNFTTQEKITDFLKQVTIQQIQ